MATVKFSSLNISFRHILWKCANLSDTITLPKFELLHKFPYVKLEINIWLKMWYWFPVECNKEERRWMREALLCTPTNWLIQASVCRRHREIDSERKCGDGRHEHAGGKMEAGAEYIGREIRERDWLWEGDEWWGEATCHCFPVSTFHTLFQLLFLDFPFFSGISTQWY